MPRPTEKHNRGPAAAAGNRAALLSSARRLFAEQGYHVPLSTIAREAGVGQAVLYRHFPTKQDIATATFEENLAGLESAAGEAEAFAGLWREIVDQLSESVGFVEIAFNSGDPEQYDGFESRLRALLDGPLAEARSAGTVDGLDVDDLLLVLRMIVGAVHVEGGVAERRRAARQALDLIGRGLQLAP